MNVDIILVSFKLPESMLQGMIKKNTAIYIIDF